MMEPSHKSILLFDGECNLCEASVLFVLKHEKKPHLYFCPLQSSTGGELLKQHAIDSKTIGSVVLIEHNKAYTKSTAALRVLKYLKIPYSLGYVFIIIPSPIRDYLYDWIAKNRYKWFGKKDSCIVPNDELLKRFL